MDQQDNSVKTSSKRKKILTYFFMILLLIGIGVAIYWFLVLRNHQETDDAYASGNQVMVSAQISGNITQINVDDMDFVHQGDVLIVLDDTDAKFTFAQSKEALASAVRSIKQLEYTVQQLQATVQANQITLARAEGDFARRQQLSKSGAIDQESLQHAKEAVALADAQLQVAKSQLLANQALLGNTPLTQQPSVKNAIDNVKQAWLNLQRTQIRSPLNGYVARRTAQVGARATVGSPLLAVIATDDMWVDANFKETQLVNMRIGQPATLVFDLYGDKVEFEGKVEGIELGTGSAFSLLPAQNATGNWIKVIQRVPVRIRLNKDQLAQYPLRIGLSATVNVNTADTSGEVLLSHKRLTPIYRTDVLDYDLAPVNELIEQIISENSK
ncbi:membrane fusion protein (multidrug efflux system) [Volucribacter psittacicida]|uniref:Membrane fusion protein (Multidrug efflux system) n=1 Tax=Volucribacter psittacicida TaxID=203482 RepID=A0A4R1FXT5_9PAST|nr:EmrA/EmrK family multidrug efflux transporter periplasmic adaptor subunit [Volucribacter psittacicida]TCJ98549.1 membrane fusion protein (multidrug efflux system) [Volucribacter psittacicida]